ncbi:MAG: DUF3656 domain-containing protein, partial [Propionivibrio sp.]
LPVDLVPGTLIHRNRDQQFERMLEGDSAERRIAVALRLEETPNGFALHIEDERGVCAVARLDHAQDVARNPERALSALRDNLGKLGATIYCAQAIDLALSAAWFLPVSAVNGLRRVAVETLDLARANAWRRLPRRLAVEPPVPYPEESLSYLGNVFNARARAFYEKHGVRVIEPAFECQQEHGEVSLMITKHCLRYSFNLCPKQVKGIRPDPMLLINGNDKLTLRFDCKPCEMHVIGKLKTKRIIQIAVK